MAMSADHYAGAAAGWASGASRVYGPLAVELVGHSPHPLSGRPLSGRRVLDVGAGTGCGSSALATVGALPLSLDLSHAMLRWNRNGRPPSLIGDVARLPVRDRAVDDVLAADWYLEFKATTAPEVGSAEAMAEVADAAPLVDVEVEERAVDVAIDSAADLVDYRLGQAQQAGWSPSTRWWCRWRARSGSRNPLVRSHPPGPLSRCGRSCREPTVSAGDLG
jgi:hypothetical protein